MFLENLREHWINRQEEEEEETFLELEDQCGNHVSLPKKRKRGKKKKVEDQTDPIANYAAQLQIEFLCQGKLTANFNMQVGCIHSIESFTYKNADWKISFVQPPTLSTERLAVFFMKKQKV